MFPPHVQASVKNLAHELWEYGTVDVLAHSELIKFSKKKKPSLYLTSFIKPLQLSEKHTDKVHRKGLEGLQKNSCAKYFLPRLLLNILVVGAKRGVHMDHI